MKTIPGILPPRALKISAPLFAWDLPNTKNKFALLNPPFAWEDGIKAKGEGRMVLRLVHVPTMLLMVSFPHLQTDCAPQTGNGLAAVLW